MNAPAQAGLPALPLKDPKLFRTQCYIDGEWTGNGKTFPVVNPATGAHVASVPDLGAPETRRAIEAAERAWPAWRAKTAKERGAAAKVVLPMPATPCIRMRGGVSAVVAHRLSRGMAIFKSPPPRPARAAGRSTKTTRRA